MEIKKIKDFTFKSEVNDLVVQLSNIRIKQTQAKDDYASMLAYDGETIVEAKIWNFKEEIKAKLKSGEIYKVKGTFKDYQGKMQLNISDINLVLDSDGIDKSAFYDKAKMNVSDLQDIITSYINKIDNKILSDIVIAVIKKYYKPFFSYPAAVVMHHNYLSGLAYHTYSMLVLADSYLKLYDFLNKDLVYSGIILHDIGKVIEFSDAIGTEYTLAGKLIGHISIGSNIIYEVSKELGYDETDEVILLNHIILSHHGELEYGSPKEPSTPEALLIHLVDLGDSKLAALEKELKRAEKGNFTGPINSFDKRSFYFPDIK